ncbi:MAG: glycerol-3-phosphate dehydrogenase/oxidase [Acidobacteria bacterium]|nr:glycerol-3-phosphate dehydrogenase/oxidase [Acidobacteriota bacterium]
MKRNLKTLATETFDLVVVGGGVTGLAIARDAAMRGLAVALVEKDDFGAGNSSNSLKIVHGGLRYLQHLDFRRMRQSIRERRILLATAPHLVKPLGFLLPTHGHGLRGRLAMGAALALNDLVGWDRDATTDPERRLPRGRILSPSHCRELAPMGLPPDCTGGALWYDAQMLDSERLLVSMAESASEAGAALANHAPVCGLLRHHGKIAGVTVEDGETGERFPLRGLLTVNAAGACLDSILQLDPDIRVAPQPLSVAMNLVLKRPLLREVGLAVSTAISVPDPEARIRRAERMLFITPWRQGSLIGTFHLPFHEPAEEFRLSRHHLNSFLQEVRTAMPWAALSEDDIGLIHAGLLPSLATTGHESHAVLAKHPRIIDHARMHGQPGLLSVMGVKWTTARDLACKTVNTVFRILGKKPAPCLTATAPFPGGDIHDMKAFQAAEQSWARGQGWSGSAARRLAERYGTRWRRLAASAPGSLEPLAPGSQVLAAEATFAVRHEMALSLTDLVRRRTDMGTAAAPMAAELTAAASIMAEELGWSRERMDREIAAVQRLYAFPAGTP